MRYHYDQVSGRRSMSIRRDKKRGVEARRPVLWEGP